MPDDRGRAEALADAMRRFLDQKGLAARVEQASVLETWPALVGPAVAEAARPLSITADGTLFVAVRTAAWMNELAMMEREILAALNRSGPRSPILRIRWQLAR
jgi:predicted nucleic acid-binding Zn ribbon protein